MIYVEEGEQVYVTNTVFNKETGLPTRQVTTLNGLEHAPPDGSPSLIAYDRMGRPTHKTWHAYGKEHRLSGPSSVVMFPETGVHMTEDFMIKGKPIAPEDGPFRIRRDKEGKIWQEDFATSDGKAPGSTPPKLEF